MLAEDMSLDILYNFTQTLCRALANIVFAKLLYAKYDMT